MKMTPVTSSNIAAMWYDLEKSELYIKFKNGKKFAYLGVTQEEYGRLINAASIGKHFNQFIKAVKVGREVVTAENDTTDMSDKIRSMLSEIYNAGFEAGEVGDCDINIVAAHEEEIISLVLSAEKDKEKIKVLREALETLMHSTGVYDIDGEFFVGVREDAKITNAANQCYSALEATKDGE